MKTNKIYLLICLMIAVIQLMVCDTLYAQLYDTAMQKYTMVKTWKGTISINYSGRNEVLNANNSLNSTVYLTNETGSLSMMWPFPDVTKLNPLNCTIQETYTEDCLYSINASGQMNWNVLLGINIMNKTYDLHCSANEQISGTMQNCDGETNQTLTGFHPGYVDIKDFPIEVSYVKPVLKGNKTFEEDGINVNIDWNLEPVTGESQVTLDPVDENWLPENNSVITTIIRWDADEIPTQVKFTLYDISKEPGTCLNSIERDKSLDMGFDPDWVNENHYTITQENENELVAQRTSLELNNELTVSIKCFDYGASAKLKAEILINNVWKTAVAKDGFENFISIPVDKDNDKIADKWEADNEVSGLSPDSDMDRYPISNEIGDAITLYEEYRGFFILSPDKKHTRTDPSRRELFVIDMDELFSVPAWENASGIMAYRLDDSMVKGGSNARDSRIVDFNQEYASLDHKYSVRLIKRSEIIVDNEGGTLLGMVPPPALYHPPKYCDNTLIYVEAINSITDKVIQILYDCRNVTDETLKQHTRLTREQLNRIIEMFQNTSVISTIKEFFVNRTVLHEVGHSCAVDHHDPVDNGKLSCPMKYNDVMAPYSYIKYFLMDMLEFITANGEGETIISFENSRFCSVPFFACFNELRVRDD